jgi:hypothetical protein
MVLKEGNLDGWMDRRVQEVQKLHVVGWGMRMGWVGPLDRPMGHALWLQTKFRKLEPTSRTQYIARVGSLVVS